MPLYTVSIATVAAASNAPYALISAPTRRMRIREISHFNNAATASSVGIGRPANAPTGTSITLGQAQDPTDAAGTGGLHSTWSVAPTAPTVYMRRIALPATIAVGISWVWSVDVPLVVPAAGFIVLWNFGASAGSVQNLSVTFEE